MRLIARIIAKKAVSDQTKRKPFIEGRLAVSELHTVYYRQYGNTQSPPALFLHGGPGSGCHEGHTELFDLAKTRLILHDQRGAGLSTPKGSLIENTTQNAAEDIEKIRDHLNIDRWLVVGGSWGGLLALYYAQNFPHRVTGIVIRSPFLGTQEELFSAFIRVPKIFYPDAYQRFMDLLPESEQSSPLSAYYRRILSDDQHISVPAAFFWHDYERILSQINPTPSLMPAASALESFAQRPMPNTPRIEAHYFSRNCFLSAGEIIGNMQAIRTIPGSIVQSRFDLLCPPQTAWRIHHNWECSSVRMVPAAGHSQGDPQVTDNLRTAISTLQQGRRMES